MFRLNKISISGTNIHKKNGVKRILSKQNLYTHASTVYTNYIAGDKKKKRKIEWMISRKQQKILNFVTFSFKRRI